MSLWAYYIAVGLMVAAAIMLGFALCAPGTLKLREKLFFFLLCAAPGSFAMDALRAHTGAMCWVYLAVLLMDRALRRERGGGVVGMLVALTLACFGDATALITGVAPIAIYCVYNLLTSRQDAGRRRRLWKLAAFSAAAAVLSFALDKLYFRIGGANKNSFLEARAFEPLEKLGDKLIVCLKSIFLIGDAGFFETKLFSIKTPVYFINTIVVLLGLLLVCRSVWRWLRGRESDAVSCVLSLGFILLCLVFVITDVASDITSSRYLATCMITFAVLIIRNREWLLSGVVQYRRGVIALCALAMAVSCADRVAEKLSVRQSIPHQQGLADFLCENGLTEGYASFWTASSTTVSSHGGTKVRAVVCQSIGCDFFNWFCKDSWYREPAHFVVARADDMFGVTPEAVERDFGPPDRLLNYDIYTVFVYEADISDRLRVNWLRDGVIEARELFADGDVTMTADGCTLNGGCNLVGPYIPVPPGRYRVVMRGVRLNRLDFDVWSNEYGGTLPVEQVRKAASNISYIVTIPEGLTDVEFREFNRSDEAVFFERLTVEPLAS